MFVYAHIINFGYIYCKEICKNQLICCFCFEKRPLLATLSHEIEQRPLKHVVPHKFNIRSKKQHFITPLNIPNIKFQVLFIAILKSALQSFSCNSKVGQSSYFDQRGLVIANWVYKIPIFNFVYVRHHFKVSPLTKTYFANFAKQRPLETIL